MDTVHTAGFSKPAKKFVLDLWSGFRRNLWSGSYEIVDVFGFLMPLGLYWISCLGSAASLVLDSEGFFAFFPHLPTGRLVPFFIQCFGLFA